ncbi:MAG: hypothetical protein KA239_00065 [Bacteroidia bacterium]|nr:hypothetical protein [Bacteroidia bacterium]
MIDYKMKLTARDAVAHCNVALPSLRWDMGTIGLFCQCNLVDSAHDEETGQWLLGLASLEALLHYLASVNRLARAQGRD